MPVSEAPNDTRELVRVRFHTGLTDNVAGVELVRGEAQNGCTPAVAERLRAIFGGGVVEVLGTWAVVPPPAPEAPPLPAAEGAHAADEPAAADPASPTDESTDEPSDPIDLPAAAQPAPARRRRPAQP